MTVFSAQNPLPRRFARLRTQPGPDTGKAQHHGQILFRYSVCSIGFGGVGAAAGA
jgi:hypothetical protein